MQEQNSLKDREVFEEKVKAIELRKTLLEIWPKITQDMMLGLDYLLEMINDEENYQWTLEQERNMLLMTIMSDAEKLEFSKKNPSSFGSFNIIVMNAKALVNSVDMDDQGFEGYWIYDDKEMPVFVRWIDKDGEKQ